MIKKKEIQFDASLLNFFSYIRQFDIIQYSFHFICREDLSTSFDGFKEMGSFKIHFQSSFIIFPSQSLNEETRRCR